MAEQPNLQELMEKAKEMQLKMQQAQDELSRTELTGESGGGLVKITMTGRHDAAKVTLSDEVLKESKEILQDLIAAAINDANRKVEKASQGKIVDLTKSMGLPAETTQDEG
jgi:DNA-binding YbaB/EbfC family protein